MVVKSIFAVMLIGLLWLVLEFINSQIDQYSKNIQQLSSQKFYLPQHNHNYQPIQPKDSQINSSLPYIYYTNDLIKLNKEIDKKYNKLRMNSNFKFNIQIIQLKLQQEQYEEEIGMGMALYSIKETIGKFFTPQQQQNSTVLVKFNIYDMIQVIQEKQKLKTQQTTRFVTQYIEQITTSIKHLNFNQTSNTFWLQSILGQFQSQIVRKGKFINLNFIILPSKASQKTLQTIHQQLENRKNQFKLQNGLHDKKNNNSYKQVSSKKIQTRKSSLQTQKTRKRKSSRNKALNKKKSNRKN